MTTDEVRTNYNAVGLQIIEQMYSADYLSIGGLESTQSLADAAGINANSRVLDVGSGLGGPVLYLASRFGCQVVGLDLVSLNVTQASERASARQLDQLVRFHEGDATHMPFDDNAFDCVIGQDAWCHVPDKNALIRECARVCESGGKIAFTDWLVTGPMTKQRREEVLSAAASTAMGTRDDYRQLLSRHGFDILGDTDISKSLIDQYRAIMAGLEGLQAQISEQFSPKVYRIVAEKNGLIYRAFSDKSIGGARFVASKR